MPCADVYLQGRKDFYNLISFVRCLDPNRILEYAVEMRNVICDYMDFICSKFK